LLFPNVLIFVEGESDKIAYSNWAECLGFNFKQKGVSFIAINGKAKGKYHLGVWVEAIKNTNLPFFMILDKDAEKETQELIANGKITNQDNFFILAKGAIEDYYPIKTLTSAIYHIYRLKLAEADEKGIADPPRCEKIEALLCSKLKYRPYWKVSVAQYVGVNTKVSDIESEIKAMLKKIYATINI
jgi:predicted ATP-dependent endonuclease of OLD family